jgi:hypothetical protein
MKYSINCGCEGMGGDLSISSIKEAIKFIIKSLSNPEPLRFYIYMRIK